MSGSKENLTIEDIDNLDISNGASKTYIELRSRKINVPKHNRPDKLHSKHDFDNNSNSSDCDSVIMAKFELKTAIALIPEFDGTSENLHKFVRCCEIILEPLEGENINSFMAFIPSKLAGKAYDIVRYKTFKTWADLKSTLKNRFGEIRALENIQMELISVYQFKNEDVRSFASRVEKLLSQLNESCIESQGSASADLIEKLNSKTAIKAFQEGLLEPIKLIVKACRFEKLQDSISKAVEEEISISKFKRVSNLNTPSTSQIICSSCGNPGHIFRNCNLIKGSQYTAANHIQSFRPNYSSSFRNNPKQINHFQLTCAYCKKTGHHIRQCFRKKAADQRSQIYNQSSDIQSTNTKENLEGSSQTLNGTPCRIQAKP